MEKGKRYNDLIKDYKANAVYCEGKKSEIYAVAHCGLYGTKNRGDIQKKRKENLIRLLIGKEC